jgi:hypothetical protein
MPKFATITLEWRLPRWDAIHIVARTRLSPLSEIEREEERCLEAMQHWHDPGERMRNAGRGRHSLVDDNPASG